MVSIKVNYFQIESASTRHKNHIYTHDPRFTLPPTRNMSVFRPRIAIVGGGPSGLALGQLLHQRGIRATIYELRAKSTPEELAEPSGVLDLHEESGLAAMRECGL